MKTIKKVIITMAVLVVVSTTLGIGLSALIFDSTLWFIEMSIIFSGVLSCVFIFMYVTAWLEFGELDLNTGQFKASADFSNEKEPFILITKVTPLKRNKEDKEND